MFYDTIDVVKVNIAFWVVHLTLACDKIWNSCNLQCQFSNSAFFYSWQISRWHFWLEASTQLETVSIITIVTKVANNTIDR